MGFPDSSVGKESACNARDPGSIPGSGRSTEEGTEYPLQYSWASLVAQLVKNPPAMQETWVWSLGWKDPLEKGKATHSSYSGLENSMDYTVHGVAELDATERLSLSLFNDKQVVHFMHNHARAHTHTCWLYCMWSYTIWFSTQCCSLNIFPYH